MRRSYLLAAGSAVLALGVAAVLPAQAQQGTQPRLQGAAPAASEHARLTAFLDAEFAQELKLRPQLATRLGSKEGEDRLDDISEAGQLQRLEWRRASVARMKAQFDRAKLSPEAQASYDIWAFELTRAEASYRYRRYQPPFYSFLYSVHSELPNFLINTHVVQDAADMRAYAARLRALPAVLDTAIGESRKSTAMGVRAPRFEVERVISGSRTLITGAPFSEGPDSPLWADAKAKVGRLQAAGKVTPGEADALLADTRTALLGMRPAYERVIAWAEGELPKAPSGRVGAISLPGGAEWYATALKLNTTTDLTPEQVHQLGLSEVARIEHEQDLLARQAGFADREAYYADREKLYPPQPWTDALRADYLARANATIAHTRELLPKWFGLLPAYRVEVVREPSFSEVAGGAAHAAGPSPDGARPGRVYVHLLGVTDDPADVYNLMCHEGIPGHVLQGDIAVRQTGAPKFRRAYGYVAYQEGWALYTEALCKEMGVYPDVAADFMRLDAELFRAARLVVDTGIHAKGWTEDQAVDYMIKTGRRPPNQARSEVRRYITLPGQATGYKIGMLKILDLRHKAERELGPKFDIKAFHDLVVGSGSQPLTVLETRVNQWIADRR
ncbi:DUF885 domain-containing protein [Phenylobacterium soli]|uniref:DUF885 domain-containing protein n=1 Tax=Phenylobacterium soli TaxID=2170551 RepID=A0A328APP2_9CAUL|nr:DUF885 domain-containing protein [Phenylobacterium soli]RAK56325.1 DUF885 domain-containing protein [Phenylobacterium soli]